YLFCFQDSSMGNYVVINVRNDSHPVASPRTAAILRSSVTTVDQIPFIEQSFPVDFTAFPSYHIFNPLTISTNSFLNSPSRIVEYHTGSGFGEPFVTSFTKSDADNVIVILVGVTQ